MASPSPFAAFVREQRENRGLTLFAAAMQAGLTPSAMQSYERGSSPRLVNIPKLARALGVDAHRLLDAALADSAPV